MMSAKVVDLQHENVCYIKKLLVIYNIEYFIIKYLLLLNSMHCHFSSRQTKQVSV